MPLNQRDIITTIERRSRSRFCLESDDSEPLSPPILADFRLKLLQERVAEEKRKNGTNYKFFVLGSAKHKNIVQVAAVSDNVMQDLVKTKKDLDLYGGLSFMINALPTRGYFDFDCPVFEDETIEGKSQELEDWIKHRFLACLYTHLKVPKSHHDREIISTKHRKKKASFHVIIPVITPDPRAWSYIMRDFWAKHDTLLAESWAFMRTNKKNYKNSQAFGVEDGAPRGAPFGSPVHQWIEYGRTHRNGLSPWDAHPQRTQSTDYVLKTDESRYGKRKIFASQLDDKAARRLKKFKSVSSEEDQSKGFEPDSSSNDSVAVWDHYPNHCDGVKLAFGKVSEMTGCSIYDMDLIPCAGTDSKSFIVKYRPTEKAKECPFVKGHRHKSNNMKFKLVLNPLALYAGCHSSNHPPNTPKWKVIFRHEMSPFEPPETPCVTSTLSADVEAAYFAVPTSLPFRIRVSVGERTFDITNKTEEVHYYSYKNPNTGGLLRLPKPSCLQFDKFINGNGGRYLVNKCYLFQK